MPARRESRVALRPLRPADQDEFIAGMRASRRLHGRWLSPPTTPEQFGEWLRRTREEAFVALRAFPVIYARDVEVVAAFYTRLGFREGFRMAAEDGSAGFIRLERDGVELGVTTEESPRVLAGVQPGPGPRHELFVYVADVDATVATLQQDRASVVREPADMFWGERLAYVADPEGNLVVLAGAAAT